MAVLLAIRAEQQVGSVSLIALLLVAEERHETGHCTCFVWTQS